MRSQEWGHTRWATAAEVYRWCDRPSVQLNSNARNVTQSETAQVAMGVRREEIIYSASWMTWRNVNYVLMRYLLDLIGFMKMKGNIILEL